MKPKLEGHPRLFANKLDSLLVGILPSKVVLQQQIISRAVHKTPEQGSGQEPTPGPSTSLAYNPAIAEPLWVTRWMSKVTGVFKLALELRMLLDKAGGQYAFDFYGIGEQVVLDGPAAMTEKGLKGRRQSRAFVTLLPALKGRLPTKRGHSAVTEMCISQATFVECLTDSQPEDSGAGS